MAWLAWLITIINIIINGYPKKSSPLGPQITNRFTHLWSIDKKHYQSEMVYITINQTEYNGI